MIPVRRLNHAVLFVSDLGRSVSFYRELFGFEVVAREARLNAAFLRAAGSTNHHDLGLFGLGSQAAPAPRGTAGLYHLAWQVDTIEALAEAKNALLGAGAFAGASSHGATKSLYGADPDGNQFEIMWMLPRHEWGHYEHEAVVEPIDLDAEVARWHGTRTADVTA
jgi:catechol-2,3-dioxygenase